MKINIFLNLNTMLSILLFLIALGVLVSIHELGHFIAAKSFKVYCSDFSIGFGPKILKLKRKNIKQTERGQKDFCLTVFDLLIYFIYLIYYIVVS